MTSSLLHKSFRTCYRILKRAGYIIDWDDDGIVTASLTCAGITIRQVVLTFSPAGRVSSVEIR